ncbi:disulfide bond formation protein B [Gilvimarinus chinensis]|uniref:disulfide bond formation protein B n=1 Tax=Gilvimarinus chinensis TaxID=396005 RepID=UPI00037FE6A2|nr:disulfide bond formation protein B [Gilvimarinus chinensis]
MLSQCFTRFFSAAGCRNFWLVVAVLMLALEGGALYFQYVKHFYPCELCIYVRVWVAALFLLSVVALWLKRWRWGRVGCALTGLGLSVGLGIETWNLMKVEYGIGHGSACGFRANFPEWAPLDSWLPWMFEVQDMCQATPPVLWGLTMAHGLAVVSVGLIGFFFFALLGCLRSRQATM